MFEIKKYDKLELSVKNTLNQIIQNECGHIPIVSQTEWSTPDWTIIYYKEHQISTFYNVVERTIIIDNHQVKVAGINNVVTPAPFRGQGLASKTLRTTEEFIFNDLKTELALLLCADAMIPFYNKLGWYVVDCPVHFNQSSGDQLWQANTMLLSKEDKITPKSIHLNGLPW